MTQVEQFLSPCVPALEMSGIKLTVGFFIKDESLNSGHAIWEVVIVMAAAAADDDQRKQSG